MELVDGTTLKVVKDIGGGKVVCKCVVCNHTDVYNKKYVMENGQECRHCKKIKKLYGDTSLNETNELNILLKEEQLRKSGELGVLRTGRKYVNTDKKYTDKIGDIGDGIVAVGVYGKWENKKMQTPTHIITKCLPCGALKLREVPKKKNVKVKYICKTCDKIAEYDKEQRAKMKKLEEEQKVESNKDNKDNEQVKEAKRRKKEAEELAKYEDTIRENNEGHYVRAEIVDGIKFVTLICEKCGYIVDRTKPNKNYKVGQCAGCAEMVKNSEYRGVCKLSQKGRIYNGMEVIRQYIDPIKGYMCDIKCAICGEEGSIVKDVYLIDVINGRYFHDCDYFKVEHRCQGCGHDIELSIKEILTMGDAKCTKCNTEIDNAYLGFKVSQYDVELSFNRVRRNIDGVKPNTRMLVNSSKNVYYEQTPIYRSDGEDYYRGICVNHGTRLTLSKTKINNYSCESCSDVNEEAFKVLNPSNIRIKGNKRIK